MKRRFQFSILTTVILCVAHIGWSQADYPWLRNGDQLYVNKAYTDAETAYRKALQEENKPKTSFNLGNTVYRQNRIPEAVEQYENTISIAKNNDVKADAWYNLGNAHFQNSDFEKSVEAYKESLKLRPEDEDAKKNLMLSLRQLRQQQQQEQQDQQEQEEKDQEQKKDQEEPSEGDQKENQKQQQSSAQNQSKTDQEKQTREELNKEEAKEILKAIEREDQRVQEKLKKGNAKAMPPIKDW
ncbi:MAG TPA: tetratricopeptide repeat protein [Cyclobacteriaceae bacterium]|jgi:Ca-activated chloride channel homolog